MKSICSSMRLVAMAFVCFNLLAEAQSPMPDSTAVATSDYRVVFPISGSSLKSAMRRCPDVFLQIDSLLAAVEADSLQCVKRLEIVGSASPDGSSVYNRRLSRRRAATLANYFSLRQYVNPDSTSVDWVGANWSGLRQLVESTPDVPDRSRIISIIDSPNRSSRLQRIKQLSGGRTYRWLLRNIFGRLRSTTVAFTISRQLPVDTVEADTVPLIVDSVTAVVPTDTITSIDPAATLCDTAQIEPDCQPFVHKLYLKTNVIGWAIGCVNGAIELDLRPHLSLSLPFYYSAWEYGTHKLKFRTVAFQPELRLWSRTDNLGLFGGVHFGIAGYNTAIGGRHRYQDYGGNTPALGGGLALGYRCHFGHSNRWLMELSAGVGVYHLNYEVFDNSSVKYGSKLYDKRKTFVGLDNIGVTFIYVVPTKWRNSCK